MKKKLSLIAIDPGYREIGFSHFEADNLVDFGVKSLRRPRRKQNPIGILKEVIERFIAEKAPDIIIIEKNSFSHINQNQPVMRVIQAIKRIAHNRGIPIFEFAPNTIRKEICNDGKATKRQVAKTICARFPELLAYFESNRKWRERYYQNMFDAVACGLTYLKLNGK